VNGHSALDALNAASRTDRAMIQGEAQTNKRGIPKSIKNRTTVNRED